MRKIMNSLALLMLGLMLFSCNNVINFTPVQIPNFEDFEHSDSFAYGLEESKNLILDIDVCTTKFEVNVHGGSNVYVQIAYDDDTVLDLMNFSQNGENIRITKTNASTQCENITAIDSYVIISIPKVMSEVTIDINSYASKAVMDELDANTLSLLHINGDVEVNNSSIENIDIDVSNGNITISNVNGLYLDLKTTNGNIRINQAEMTHSIFTSLSNGDTRIEHISTDSLVSSLTNGDALIESVEIGSLLNVTTVNGKIEGKLINNELLVLKGSSVLKTTNGEIKLNDVYLLSVDLITVNGNIYYLNSTKGRAITTRTASETGEMVVDI